MSRVIRTVAILGLVFFLSVGAEPNSTGPQSYRCNYEARYACMKSGCKPVPRELVSHYVLVPSLHVFEQAESLDHSVEIGLCDAEGCTPVEMHAFSSGAFLDLTQANRGTQYMKIFTTSTNMPAFGKVPGYSRGDFSEVQDALLVTFIGYGHCRWPSE